MTPTDRIRTRTTRGLLREIREHLEAMQRDLHGLEYDPWKVEVDGLWRRVFEQISLMADDPQQSSLQMIQEDWMTYIRHYATAS